MGQGGGGRDRDLVPDGPPVPCSGVTQRDDPFLVPRPCVIGLSGGRSSAYMLRRVLDAHGGTLPGDVHAAFANTGLIHPEAMDFVRGCSSRWGVPVTVLEYDPSAQGSTRVVSWDEASRDGTPFSALLSVRRMLPGAMARFCTSELKVRRLASFARDAFGHEAWHYVSGVRADEPGPARARMNRHWSGKDGGGIGTPWMPLVLADVDARTVDAFWAREGLAPDRPEVDGRCDNCFLRGTTDICGNMRRRPWTADWWVGSEAAARPLANGRRDGFRRDGPRYADLLARVTDQADLFDATGEAGQR